MRGAEGEGAMSAKGGADGRAGGAGAGGSAARQAAGREGRQEGGQAAGACGCSSPSLRAAAGAHSARVWRARLRAAPERGTAEAAGARGGGEDAGDGVVRWDGMGDGMGNPHRNSEAARAAGAAAPCAERVRGGAKPLARSHSPQWLLAAVWGHRRGRGEGL